MKKNFTLLGALFISGLAFAQVGVNTITPQATLDVVGKPTDISVLDGVIAPRITGEQLRAKNYTTSQQGALVYVTNADTAPAGQTINITAVGYYYFDGTLWQKLNSGLPAAPVNIYNASGTLTSGRTVTLGGNQLNFMGTLQRTSWGSNGILYQENLQSSGSSGISLAGGSGSNLWIQQFYNDKGRVQAQGNATALELSTSGNTASAPVTISTSSGGGALGSEKMRITGEGNVGVNTTGPTEKFDNNGITRLRTLPLNGTPNAINTTPAGAASATQDQTFTATRTIVADANGVLGYVNTLPSDAGTSKALVIANAPGTQDISAQVAPSNPAIGQFTNESLDIYNAWTNNEFTVPANMGGIYVIVMQNSSTHTSTGSATPTWHTMAYYEKSTDGGANWSTMIKHTYSNLAGTIVDNGNTLYWTGILNVGDKIRVRFSCNATTVNTVNYGGISITKLAQ